MRLLRRSVFIFSLSTLALVVSDAAPADDHSARVYSVTVTAHAATCHGTTPCRACKNCRYCGHCAKRGGTCGVCRR